MLNNGYHVVPLSVIVNFVLGRGSLPARAVAITADDRRISVYIEMRSIVERFRIPATLFLYPSTISNASYAMTWQQLRELRRSLLFYFRGRGYLTRGPAASQRVDRLNGCDHLLHSEIYCFFLVAQQIV